MSLRLKTLLHLFLVYISWGTTYIGFKLTLEVLGPFFCVGFRMALGGLLLCLLLMLCGRWRRPALRDLRHAAIYGIFMCVVASGFLSRGQLTVPSGVAGVICGSTPISMMLFGLLLAGEKPPSPIQWAGLFGGFCGLIILAASQRGGLAGHGNLAGMLWIVGATFGWVGGSLLLRRFPERTAFPPLQSCGLLLLVGGLESVAVGLFCGEASAMRWHNLRPAVAIAFSWMVVGGGILAYSSYFWLLEHVSIATAISYEYVVPVIGIFLGWWIGGEEVSSRMLLGCALTIGSVFFVVRGRSH